jgi:diaminopimelate decarboxylase
MDYFAFKNGRLHCEDVDVETIAQQVGTPVYIYSAATLEHHYRELTKAFGELEPTICFSIKSLSNLSVLRLLKDLGSGFDVVSGGEVARAREIGADMSKVVYAGVGKTDKEITEALQAGVGLFNVESEAEFENLSRLAEQLGVQAHAALRVNPDVDPKTHRYTTTGKKETKFGVDIERAERFFETYGRDEHARLDAIHLHIGSPVYSPEPYVEAIRKTLAMIERVRGQGFEVSTLDIGGGFGADYEAERSPLAGDYAAQIVPLLKGQGLKVILEPGRQIAANAGILLSKVLYIKQGGERNFVIVDAAMTDLLRPALYEAEHFIWPAKLADRTAEPDRTPTYAPDGAVKVDVVGGVCESSDFLCKERMLPPMQRDDLLAVFSAGAYGFVMSSQYNSRPRPAEVLVSGSDWKTVRERETYDDLLARER